MAARILMTADTVGGVWTYALELARALHQNGNCEIALATMGRPLSPRQWEEAHAVPNLRVHEGRFKLEWMDDPWDDVRRAGDWLLDLEARLRPDVVHLNGYAHGNLPFRAPVLCVGHSCVLSWWRAVKGEDAPPEWGAYRRAVRQGLWSAHAVAAPTPAMLRALQTHYGPLPDAFVVPNGRDPSLFSITDKEPVILSAGRLWDEAKNVGALASAAPALPAPWAVHVAGEARHPEGGEAAPPNVHLLGLLSPRALAGRLARASIYALPARYEPFGLSALEAALSGCALVLGDIPSLREVWGDAAVFVSPDDPDALRHALQSLAQDPALRTRLANAALSRARAYTPRRMADGYREIYGKIALTPRPPLPNAPAAPVGEGVPVAQGVRDFAYAASFSPSPTAQRGNRERGPGGEGS